MACLGHLAVLVLLAFFPPATLGKAFLSLRMVRFDNPGGKGDNGHCCDGRAFICPSECDHLFVICIDRRYGRPDTMNCPFGKKWTQEIENKDSIVFGNTVGGLKNPILFDFNVWPGQVRVKIEVWDKDDSNSDDLVDFLQQDVILRPSPSRATARTQRYSVRDRVTLFMNVQVYCGEHYYGSRCDVLCRPQNNGSMGYSCNQITGRKICLPGWTGRDCNVSADDCGASRCQHGATCLDGHLSYTCLCVPGYTGQYCAEEIDECLSDPCLNNGTCLDDVDGFTCTCDPLWTGVTCEVRDVCSRVSCANNGTCFNVNGSFICNCAQGFAGVLCDRDVDECLSSPCLNGATCTDLRGAFQCACAAGWEGVTCDLDVDECQSGPCVNASRCQNLHNDFACVCLDGFTGKKCDTDIDECLRQPCKNGGSCTNQIPGFRCACPAGFQGDECEVDIDECASNPCHQDATCVNLPGSFRCSCHPDFTGPRCDHQIDDCLPQLCEHNGTCVDEVHDFRCICTEHYKGRKCGVYIDRCESTPCSNAAQCRDPGYGHTLECRCSDGWQGSLCTEDVNECLQMPCANGAECQNTQGGYQCLCPEGWTGFHCQEDVNECQQWHGKQTSPANTTVTSAPEVTWCQHAELCINVDGSFMCVCLKGWAGPRCRDDLDECGLASPPCQNGGRCNNTVGSFQCHCPDAWTGETCDTDVDECQRAPCQPHKTCVNTPGAFHCACPQGWQGENCDEDVNECQGNVISGPCVDSVNGSSSCFTPTGCQNGATCTNTPGGFTCQCPPGWHGDTCEEDVDECAIGVVTEAGQQEASSNTTPGHPTSSTKPSVPHGDGGGSKTSEGLLQERRNSSSRLSATSSHYLGTTVLPVGGAPCENGGVCQNTAGSFTCRCPPHWSGSRCQQDVDECALGSNPCQNGGECLNHAEGFSCRCQYPWEGPVCSERRSCPDRPCGHNATCLGAGTGGVQCICPRGWRGPLCSHDRDECDLHPCLHGGTCVNERGSFRCVCPENITGRTCSNGTSLDDGVVLPLYFQGHLTPRDKDKVKMGINDYLLFLGRKGYFRHDISIRAYLQTHELSFQRSRTPVTQVSVTIVVENVTLSNKDGTEMFNWIPPSQLERYFPLPFYTQEIKDSATVSYSRHQQAPTSFPWYAIVGGLLVMIIVVCVAALIVRRMNTVQWWPRKRPQDTLVVYTSSPSSSRHNGHGAANPAFDTDHRDSDTEYVNVATPDGSRRAHSLPAPTTCGPSSQEPAGGSGSSGQANTLPKGLAAPLNDRLGSAWEGVGTGGPGGSGEGVTLCGAGSGSESGSRAEIRWTRPKEVQLKRKSSQGAPPSSAHANTPCRKSSLGAGVGAGFGEDGDDGEGRRCFINTVYMTIPPADMSVTHHLAPNPDRGALPPLPAALPSADYDVMAGI